MGEGGVSKEEAEPAGISDATIQRTIMNSARHGGLQAFRKLSSVLTIPSSG